MFKKILNKLNKYKLLVGLLLIIILMIIIKLGSKKEVNNNVNQNNSKENQINNIVEENKPTETVSINSEKITPTEDKKQEVYLSINDYAFPYEEDTFLAKRYENLKVYAKAKIDDKAKAERDLKYWFYIEIGATLPSDKIVWE